GRRCARLRLVLLHPRVEVRALLDAAEELVQHSGVEARSVRAVADHVGTTTRAVYTVYGSKADCSPRWASARSTSSAQAWPPCPQPTIPAPTSSRPRCRCSGAS